MNRRVLFRKDEKYKGSERRIGCAMYDASGMLLLRVVSVTLFLSVTFQFTQKEVNGVPRR